MEYGNGEVNHLVWRMTSNRYHHEEEGLTIENPNVNISILGSQIECGSMVLDIGCGEGKFGKLIKNKKCSLYGIEIDKEALEYAMEQGNYEDIYNFNVEMPELNEKEYQRLSLSNLKFDYIIISDVLEHTINPTKIILKVHEYLKDNGKILVSVPNVNNADIVLNLLRGRFNYMEAGILDNTHTKYFTKESFVEWICEMNECFENIYFDCKYLGGVYGLTKYLEQVKCEMPRVYELIQLNPEFNVIQNLFVLYKKKRGEHLEYLDMLLKEERTDIVEILSEWLERGVNQNLLQEINGIRMLPNERNIMEERARCAEEGWNKCARELQDAVKHIQELNSSYENALKSWELAEQKRQEVLEGWNKTEKKYKEALEGWNKTERKYKEALEGWNKTDEKYQEALVGWNKTDEKYQEAMQGWKLAEHKYQEAMQGWRACEQNYQRIAKEEKPYK